MNRIFLLSGVAAMLASGSAFAGTFDSRDLAPTAFNWTGFYLGAYGGYGASQMTATDIGDQAGTPWIILGTQFTASPTSFVGGGQVGYNHQFGQFVVGAEADVGYFNHSGSAPYDSSHPKTMIIGSGAINSTLRGRLGFTADRALFYATGGLAATSASVKLVAAGISSPDDNLSLGWTIGVGMEYAVTDNWSVKLEYLHDDFGQSIVGFNTGGIFAPDNFSIRSTDDTVRLGVNYLFK